MSIREEVVAEAVQRTYDTDPSVRRRALHDLCPCEVRAEFAEAWERALALAADPDARVRKQALHNLCDGSPATYLPRIIDTLETLSQDSEPKIRKTARKVLGHYRRTGKVNIL